ncbi:MAG TPA: CopG family antitoxin [Thermodesulfobacteriota bacterium]|nr:CopG family antitoxin [Thermodesulfobacteriota bacterium]
MAKNKKSIPEEFNSLEEIQDFWDNHSTADYWDEMETVDLELSPELKAKLELKKLYALLGFSREQIAEIEAKAKRRNVTSRQLMRKWILEHV